MGNSSLNYKIKITTIIQEVQIHLNRIDEAFEHLSEKYKFPIIKNDFYKLMENKIDLAFADQIIYRFSKAQDSIGAKLFKSFLLYQGENIDKPFRDILNSLEKIHILNVDKWFELKEVRNEIAHDYGGSEPSATFILNNIYKYRVHLKEILNSILQTIQ